MRIPFPRLQFAFLNFADYADFYRKATYSWLGELLFLPILLSACYFPFGTESAAQKPEWRLEARLGELNNFVLDSLYGLDEIQQYHVGEKQAMEMDERSKRLSASRET